MINRIISKHGTPIRLTDERWVHIIEEHCELAGMRWDVLETVAQPVCIVAGKAGELIAFRETWPGKFLVVVYREHLHDGFIITAFLTRKVQLLRRGRKQLWP